ncbi:MAG: response regulator transcription factor [Alkalispirochaeta sp.]
MKTTALVIEDDRHIANLITMHLTDAGLEVDTAGDGESGLQKAVHGRFDLIVLDLMLPGVDGLSICRSVRKQDRYVPILVVTARSAEMDKITGLELGADDYITKPFSPRELVARVHAILRRTQELGSTATDAGTSIRIGDLTIDVPRHRAFRGSDEVDLTSKEFDLLTLLARHPGQAFNREQLLDRVWGYHHDGYSHTVNSHINRLRAKIEISPSQPQYIRTVWGYGYRFAEPGEFSTSREDG